MKETAAEHYNAKYPDRPGLTYSHGWLTGVWCIGNMFGNAVSFYGAYPRGYLQRVHSMFPNAQRVLHVFSGSLTIEQAAAVAPNAQTIELVDLRNTESGCYPTWQGNVVSLPDAWHGYFDLILADPPYSRADAQKYDVPMLNRGRATRALRRVVAPGGVLVWLDQVWPMHRKADWKCWGHVAVVRSTNHRVRLASFFEATDAEAV